MRRVTVAGIFSMADVTLYQKLRKIGTSQRYDYTIK
jgi:hypothetical protein